MPIDQKPLKVRLTGPLDVPLLESSDRYRGPAGPAAASVPDQSTARVPTRNYVLGPALVISRA